MKKLLTLLLCVTLLMTMFTACGKKAETAKTGLAVISSVANSTGATADAEGLAETDSTAVAVLVDKDGKILDCKIDMAQTKINFSAEGKLTTDMASTFKSKQELGTEYGMLSKSGIKKEWNEQADAFAKYVIGKTAAEVKGIAVTAEGVASDADLAGSVTIHIGDFVAAVEKAVNNAQDLGATEADKLGLGLTTDMENSKDFDADSDGLAQAYSYYIVTTTNAKDKISSCIIDASQGRVTFDATGVITNDITVAPQTKDELKDAYGMKAASGLKKEWYEEAKAFADYATGKTLAEVKGVTVGEEGAPTTTDLVSSVTINVAPFITSIEKAMTNAAK